MPHPPSRHAAGSARHLGKGLLLRGVLVLTAVLGLQGRGGAATLGIGDLVPPLVVQTTAGGAFDLQSELKAHPVLLAFVSPRCKPCQESQPALERLSREYGTSQRLALVSVMLGREAEDAAPNSTPADAQPLDETLVHGTEATAQAYGIFGTPVFLLVGRQGTVLWKHVGRLAEGAADTELEAALAGMSAFAR